MRRTEESGREVGPATLLVSPSQCSAPVYIRSILGRCTKMQLAAAGPELSFGNDNDCTGYVPIP
jgi:hypothetical protein